jgi:hypothetical protein
MKSKARTQQLVTDSTDTRIGYWDDVSNPDYGTVSFGTSTPQFTFDTLSESIDYELPGYKSFGNCAHTRTSLEVFASGSTFRHQYPSGRYEKIVRSKWFLASLYHGVVTANPLPVFQADNWATWSSQALDEMLPSFSNKGETLINFILELKDTKSLFDLWSRRLSLLKNIANAHLNYKFGWLNFISDVQRVFGALKAFREKVRKLQEESGKPTTAHYKRPLDLGLLPLDSNVFTDTNGTWRREALWVQMPVYHATLNYVYVLPDMSTMLNQAKGFLDSLGVQLDAVTLWNAIPYSFVIDWFFDVGAWIHSLRVDNLKIPATVTGFCHSLKYEYIYRYTFTATPSFDPFMEPKKIIAQRTMLRYERRVDVPSTGLLNTTVKAPNWGKILLGASLLIQRA